jgi:hypothetical protein
MLLYRILTQANPRRQTYMYMYSTYLDIPVHQKFSLLRSWGRREVLTVHLEPFVNPPWQPTVEDGDLFVAHRLI